MLDYLLTNYKLKGLTYKQLTDLIGDPHHDYESERNELRYPILTEYGMDIDPIYTKTLLIELTNDSIVSGYKINEWKKE